MSASEELVAAITADLEGQNAETSAEAAPEETSASAPQEASEPTEAASQEESDVVSEPQMTDTQRRALNILEEKEARLRAEMADADALREKASKWEKLEQLSPLERARVLGLDLKEVQKQMVDDYDPAKDANQRIAQLEQMILQEREAREKAVLEQARNETKHEIRTFVDKGDFPLTQTMGMTDLVLDTLDSYKQANQSISKEEAARKVEESLAGLVEKALQNEDLRRKFLAEKTQTQPKTTTSVSNKLSSQPSAPTAEKVFNSETEMQHSIAAMLEAQLRKS